MEVKFAVAKISKYATSESGDTVEMIERPHGGISLVLVDGQRSGRSAKKISNIVARKAIQLLAEGIRDGAAARAAHDYLYTYRGGKVSATLNIVSVDAVTQTLVISRNNEAPVIVHTPQRGLFLLDEPSRSIGTRRNTKPVITEIPIEVGPLVVSFTDGLRHAGSWHGQDCFDPVAATHSLLQDGVSDPQTIADDLLRQAVELDDGRPRDDISVVVVAVNERPAAADSVRRLSGRLPL
ncbi:MAG TPA: SpoIIE family protein phosphatase [Candidatus Sulfomarinibacteraceae bacterium]|nr:SpoIIE family protein phosphatase [Candidatus Sulfomarinibacteraceae bacterium]